MYQLYRDRPILVLCLILANIALSFWCLRLDPVINNDGITYLAIAQMMLDGSWNQAFDYYSWPFYSFFIAAIAKLFFLEVETAAYLLNTLFVTSLTLAFVCIVAELSNNNRKIILIAMLVILLFPSITKYRSFIIRDFGYLSCYLWSLYFIFRFCRTLNKSHLVGWLVFAGLSCLFRFEGIAFLLIAPYFLFLFTARRVPHRRTILSILSISIAVVSVGLIIWYVNDKYASMIEVAKTSGKDVNNVIDLFLDNLKTELGGQELTAASYTGVIAGNVGNVVYELVRRMAVFYFLFAVYAYLKNRIFETMLIKRIWLVYVLTNFIVLIVFSLYNNFLVSRYTMATALTLLILSPFVIHQLIRAFKNTSMLKRVASITAISMLSIASLEGLDVRTNKKHLKEAGHWLAKELPSEAKIYSNDRRIAYYAEKSVVENLDDSYSNLQLSSYIKSGHIKTYDYIAHSVTPKSKLEDIYRQTLAYNFGLPIKIIDGLEEKREVYIFKVDRQ